MQPKKSGYCAACAKPHNDELKNAACEASDCKESVQ